MKLVALIHRPGASLPQRSVPPTDFSSSTSGRSCFCPTESGSALNLPRARRRGSALVLVLYSAAHHSTEFSFVSVIVPARCVSAGDAVKSRCSRLYSSCHAVCIVICIFRLRQALPRKKTVPGPWCVGHVRVRRFGRPSATKPLPARHGSPRVTYPTPMAVATSPPAHRALRTVCQRRHCYCSCRLLPSHRACLHVRASSMSLACSGGAV